MNAYAKKSIATLFAGSVLAVGVATPASAAQQQQDGLVNVAVGDITVEDVNIGVAAIIAANACDLVSVGTVAVLARNVDRSGDDRTVCTTDTGDVVLSQN